MKPAYSRRLRQRRPRHSEYSAHMPLILLCECGQPERLSGLEIHDELELRWLHNRQVRGLFAF